MMKKSIHHKTKHSAKNQPCRRGFQVATQIHAGNWEYNCNKTCLELCLKLNFYDDAVCHKMCCQWELPI